MALRTHFKTDIVKRYESGESSYKISKDEECSYNTILRELKRNKINTSRGFWSDEEIEKLREFYPVLSKRKLLQQFPSRGESGIRAMVAKLRLKKQEYKEICKNCEGEFKIKYRQEKEICPKCNKKKWEQNNIENAVSRQRRWLQKNPGYLKQYAQLPKTKERISNYFKQLRKNSPKFRLDCNMGNLMGLSLKGKKAGRKWENLVNYSLEDLIGHLEKKFDKNMTWENYGAYWQVDHIKPRSLFKYTSSEEAEFKKCWDLDNLQPLEKFQNMKKGSSYEGCNVFRRIPS